MTKFRRQVSRFFSKRGQLLRNVRGNAVRASDDFAELYVLLCVLATKSNAREANLRTSSSGKTVFVVATSPSPQWSSASHYVLDTLGPSPTSLGVRTGLEVQCHDGGTVELDLVLVPLSAVANDRVSGADVASAYEVKAHRRVLSSTLADHVRGKAARAFNAFTVPMIQGSQVSRYCLVSLHGITGNAQLCLTGARVGWCIFGGQLNQWINRSLRALGLI